MYVYNEDRGWSKEAGAGMRRAASEIRTERIEDWTVQGGGLQSERDRGNYCVIIRSW